MTSRCRLSGPSRRADAIACTSRGDNSSCSAFGRRATSAVCRCLSGREEVAVGGFQGRQQGGQIARQARDQRLGAGDLQAITGKRPRARDRGIELRVGEARRVPLGRQGAGGLAGPRRTRTRLLQQGQANLQAIIRRQRLGQQCRQQQGTFAKLPDDLRFLGHDGLRCFAWLVGQRLPAALDARQRSSTRCVKIA